MPDLKIKRVELIAVFRIEIGDDIYRRVGDGYWEMFCGGFWDTEWEEEKEQELETAFQEYPVQKWIR